MKSKKLRTKKGLDANELKQLWRWVPRQASGYAMSLKKLNWFQEAPHQWPEDSLEGRFFWQDGEINWRLVQTFNGQKHIRRYQLVWLGELGDDVSMNTQDLKPGAIVDGPFLAGAGPGSDWRVVQRVWLDRQDQPVYMQWTGLKQGEQP